jgi:uncharacterized protein (UPF0147 family)
MLINSINDESSESISFDPTGETLAQPEAQESMAFKEIEAVLSRMNYQEEKVPDTIKKAKKEAYTKVDKCPNERPSIACKTRSSFSKRR